MLRRLPAVLLATAAGLAVTLLLAFHIGDALELPSRDLALRLLPPHTPSEAVVVAIDEQSIRALGAWPWDRARIAGIVDRAADAGARAVVLDVLLSEPRTGDDRLAAAARRLPVLA